MALSLLKKRWLKRLLAYGALLLTAVVVFAHIIINLPLIKDPVEAVVADRLGGEIHFERFDLRLFPRPAVLLRGVRLRIEGKVKGRIQTLAAYPDLLKMITGNIRVGRIKTQAPRLTITVSAGRSKSTETEPSPVTRSGAHAILAFTPQDVNRFLKRFALDIEVDDGALAIVRERAPPLKFDGIVGEVNIGPSRIRHRMRCKSVLWGFIRTNGKLDPRAFKGKGIIHLSRLAPRALTDYLFPRSNLRVGAARINLKMAYAVQSMHQAEVRFEGAIPSLVLQKGSLRRTIAARSLKGAIALSSARTRFELTECDLQSPQMKLNGTLETGSLAELIHRPQQCSTRFEIKAADLAVPGARDTALTLYGDVKFIRTLFNIVRAGRVDQVAVSAQADTPALLGRNVVVKGRMRDGRIFVPGVRLDLKKVKGRVVVRNGVLEGRHLAAVLNGAQGSDGTLKVGLASLQGVLELNVRVQTDASALPGVLKRFVRYQPLHRELDQITSINGPLQGRLILSGQRRAVDVRVEVDSIAVQAAYKRLPLPLEIRSGAMIYERGRIRANDLNGSIGQSTFNSLSADLQMGAEPMLAITAGRSNINMDQVYPWLISYSRPAEAFKQFKSIKGDVNLETLTLNGALLKPAQWKYQTVGTVDRLAVQTDLLPDVLRIAHGRFDSGPSGLRLSMARIRMLDAELVTDGLIEGQARLLENIDLRFDGKWGPRMRDWIINQTALPAAYPIPAALDVTAGHFKWKKGHGMAFDGRLQVVQGPLVTVALTHSPSQFIIDPLHVKDPHSDARLTFHRDAKTVKVGFKGNLARKTVRSLAPPKAMLDGWLQGDFKLRYPRAKPADFWADGKLRTGSLQYPRKPEMALQINQFDLEAKARQIDVKSAIVRWHDDVAQIKGRITGSPREVVLDMDALADKIRIKIRADETGTATAKEKPTPGLHRRLPYRGLIRLRANAVTYGDYTWEPFQADLSFAPGQTSFSITQAQLCGISTRGVLRFDRKGATLYIKPHARQQQMRESLLCFWNATKLIEGKVDIDGKFTGSGPAGELIRHLEGDAKITSENGRIYRLGLLAKILAVINVTEIFSGEVPEFDQEGFAYNRIEINGTLADGKFNIDNSFIDGKTMEIAFRGHIDVVAKTIDLQILVAPLKTVDRVVKYIPLIGEVLGGTLVTIPLRATGDLKDPTIIPISAKAVGSGLIGIMKRTLKLPIKLVTPKKKKNS